MRGRAGRWIALLVATGCAAGCGARTGVGAAAGEDGEDGEGGAPWTSSSEGTGEGAGGAPLEPACDDGASAPPVTPILRYPFDGTTENVGALVGHDGVGVGVDFVPGRLDRAVRASGAGSVVEMPATAEELAQLGSFTVTLWFREETVTNDFPRLLDTRGFLGGFHSYHGVSGSALVTCWGAGHPDIGPGDCDSFTYEVGAWHHVAYRSDGTGVAAGEGAPLEVLLDGAPVVAFDNPTRTPIFTWDPIDLEIGRDSVFEVDELRVYDRALTDAEICGDIAGAR